MARDKMSDVDIPNGFELYTDNDRTYIRCQEREIVSVDTGMRKWFRGIDKHAEKRAANWIWRWQQGFEDHYRLARDGEEWF
jgi:hypothetical protein